MFELMLISQLLTPLEASNEVNKFCADVVGIPYASDNFSYEEWERFVYCRESIRRPSSKQYIKRNIMINTTKYQYGDDFDFNEEDGLVKHPPDVELIDDEMYSVILEKMPVFCVDWLIACKGRYLLLKRTQQPLKGQWWLIGGRLQKDETIDEAGYRLQGREIGRYCGKGEPVGFSNYFFPKLEDSRATHTPAVSFLVEVEEEFVPILDDTEDEYMWTDKLPLEYANQTTFFPNPPHYEGTV